jgi:hypothetical protein
MNTTHSPVTCALSEISDRKIQVPHCPVLATAIATTGFVVTSRYCRMGQDYDCQCTFCSDASYRLAETLATQRNQATADHRADVIRTASTFRWLAAIGTAVRAAASPGFGVSRMIADAHALWCSPIGEQRGTRFQIVGRRGTAKGHVGKVGVCRWIGRDTLPVRIGLAVEGEAKLIYVAFSQVERVPATTEEKRDRFESSTVRDAIALHRPKLVVRSTYKKRGSLGTLAFVVGKSTFGEVFWIGPDKRTGEAASRLGIRQQDGSVVWESAYNCADRPMQWVDSAERVLLERVAADAVMSGDVDRAREILVKTRVDLPQS